MIWLIIPLCLTLSSKRVDYRANSFIGLNCTVLDTRGAFRRAEVEKTVNAHVERMSARGDYPELKTVQYAFVTHQEAAFPDLFPKHARHTARSHGLDEPLAMPALKLINVRTQETMVRFRRNG
jgi:hypothetical protein